VPSFLLGALEGGRGNWITIRLFAEEGGSLARVGGGKEGKIKGRGQGLQASLGGKKGTFPSLSEKEKEDRESPKQREKGGALIESIF